MKRITVDLDTLAFELLEKRYEFSGEKIWYFSEKVIETQAARFHGRKYQRN